MMNRKLANSEPQASEQWIVSWRIVNRELVNNEP